MHIPKEVRRHQNPQLLTVGVDLTNLVQIGLLSDGYQTKDTRRFNGINDVCIKVHFRLASRSRSIPSWIVTTHKYNPSDILLSCNNCKRAGSWGCFPFLPSELRLDRLISLQRPVLHRNGNDNSNIIRLAAFPSFIGIV
jgi:hypothetical protein